MRNLFLTVKKTLPALLLALPFLACTQTQPADPMADQFDQLFRRMQEQMRRGMDFDTTLQGGEWHVSPDSTSYFYFHVDTSFNGLGGADFFQFSPFGSPGRDGFFDMDSIFEQFFNRMERLTPRQGQSDFPADDGNTKPSEDELLPEERLRLQEEQKAPQTTPAPEKPKQKTEQSKVKTIRI